MADTSFTAVDLSRMSVPDIVEDLDFATILADCIAQMKAAMAESGLTFTGRNSDPATKLLQVFTYFAQLLRQRINDAVRAVMPAYAVGADLDNIAALFGIARKTITPADTATGTAAVMESDTEFRRRMVLAPEGYSVAGPEGAYVFHALSADSNVLDATAISFDPGHVIVTIMARTADGAASQALVDAVSAYVSADTRRPLTDLVTVQSADIVRYGVDYDLATYSGPDAAVVLAASLASVEAYVAESHRLGRDVTRSALFRAAHVEGVQNVVLRTPAADIPITRLQAPYCTGISAQLAGTGE
ncbi:baseplate J/gp47 family protein [Novosphingobium sp. KA1]|uniref:baseplate assembly protein n=1 Tax=Novosphingobium sp. (strain KA1) TaxID=164608 RepID=UPI001A8DE8AC|nr:baseplate J/gp47 family protein [Novosphingobium sp. KA1]QSR17480.1 baseplate assembly protein [Novosphingobium sp. KA1]